MIFYTLKGPSHSLEIHEDKLILKKRGWFRIFGSKYRARVWAMDDLSQFNITIPQYILWGKVEWKAFDGSCGSFRFSTNPLMMKKIELYLQKKIIKNHQRIVQLKAIEVVSTPAAKPVKKSAKKSKRKNKAA